MSHSVLYTHNENISMDSSLSHLLVEWGQWIDHDLALTPQTPSTAAFSTGEDCSRTCSRASPCFPIEVGEIWGLTQLHTHTLTHTHTHSQSWLPAFPYR